MSVCLSESNKRQHGWTDRTQIFCGTSRDPREGLWMIKFSKICLHQNSIFENFENPRNYFYKIIEIFVCFCFTMYKKRKLVICSFLRYTWIRRRRSWRDPWWRRWPCCRRRSARTSSCSRRMTPPPWRREVHPLEHQTQTIFLNICFIKHWRSIGIESLSQTMIF